MNSLRSAARWLTALLVLLAACASQGPPPLPAVAPPPVVPPSPWAAADRRGEEASEDVASSVRGLASYLTEGLPTEEERVRAIFRWMTAHIRYDLKGLESSEYGDLSPEAVLKRRSAVCEGYSGLFESLVEAAGFEVALIPGFAKGVGYSAGAEVPLSFNHAWNAVKVRGEWKLLDCTWGAGALNEMGEYVAGFDPFYFFTPPEEFIYSHFPSDSQWQLLAEPMSRKAFEGLPMLKPSFFVCGLRLQNPNAGHLKERGPIFDLPVTVPAGVQVKASLLQGEKPIGEGFARLVGSPEGQHMQVLFPAPGTYTVRVFAARGQSPPLLDWAADLLVTSETGSGGRDFNALEDPRAGKKASTK